MVSTYVDGRLVFQYSPGTAQHGLFLPGRKNPSKLGAVCQCQDGTFLRRARQLPVETARLWLSFPLPKLIVGSGAAPIDSSSDTPGRKSQFDALDAC